MIKNKRSISHKCTTVKKVYHIKNALKKHLAITGFMATGKSSVAKILAHRLQRDLFDTDYEVEKKAGLTIPEIFVRFGEDYFRHLERETGEILRSYSPGTLVIATGGGFILSTENRRLLDETAITVLLTASSETILQRVGSDLTRPLIAGEDRKELIEKMLAERERYYCLYELSIATDGKTAEMVADEIYNRIFNAT